MSQTITVPINVRNFGAVGDGVADDSEPIRAAIRAASTRGAVVHFPAGTYMVAPDGTEHGNYCLPLEHGITLTSDEQARIKVKAGVQNYHGVIGPSREGNDLSGLTVQGLTIDLNGDENPIRAYAQDLPPGYSRRGVAAWKGRGLKVKDCTFTNGQNIWYAEFLGVDVDDVTIEGCTFEDAGSYTYDWDHSTIYLDCTNGHVINNTITTTRPHGARQAIEMHGGPHVISGNHVDGYVYGCDVVASSWSKPCTATVSDNVFRNVSIGVDIWSRPGEDGSLGIDGVTIADNIISLDHTKRAGVTASAGVAMNAGSHLPMRNVKITGNTIKLAAHGEPTHLDPSSQGISIGRNVNGITDTNLTIENNVIDGAMAGGFSYRSPGGTLDGLRVTGNVFRDTGAGGESIPADRRAGVHIDTGTLRHAALDDNQFIDAREACMLGDAFRILVPTLTDVRIHDNRAHAADGTVIHHVKSASTTTGQIDLRATVDGWLSPWGRFTAGSRVVDERKTAVYRQHDAPGNTWRAEPRIHEATTAPDKGAWRRGDRVFNANPAIGAPKGWVCTASGTPGTWVSEGNL